MSLEIQQALGSSLISFLLSFMLMKAWMPFARKRPGEVLLEVPLGMLQRLLLHRTQAVLILGYILLGSAGIFGDHWFLPGTQPIALAAVAVILSLPVRYVFTDLGVGIGNQIPRPYRQFRRFNTRAGRRWLAGNTTLVLEGRRQGNRTFPSFRMFLPTDRINEVTRILKRRLR